MKIKVKPEDFIVRESINLPFSKKGDYTILILEKKYWNTLDVIDFVARKLSLSKNLFSRAGLKDRYSYSTQYLSFKGDFSTTIKEKNFTLHPIGKADQPISPHHLIENEFSIILRNLTQLELEKIRANYNEIIHYGIANYFDEQRFGSAKHGKGFFAKELILKHHRGALKLFLCYPSKDDAKQVKIFKNFCREHWEEWQDCYPLATPTYKKIILYLMRKPRNYKNAIKKINRDLFNILLLAYQSYLFNLTLNTVIDEYGINIRQIPYCVGKFLFYRKVKNLSYIVENVKIPMINETTKLHGFLKDTIQSICEKENVAIKDFALRSMRLRGVRFRSFLRSAIIFPYNFVVGTPQDDDLYVRRKKIRMTFNLPPGSYATLVIKRLVL
jgi:tRNA pseudouridine13 synthase